MQCTHCGAFVPNNTNFCLSCGAPVSTDSTQQAQTYQNQQPYGQAQTYQNQQTYGQAQTYQNQQSYGQPYQNQQTYGQPYQNQAYGQPYQNQTYGHTKADFNHHPSIRKYNGNLIGACCILYFCAAITLIVNVLLYGNIFSFVDFSIILGLTLGIHLAKSRVCAIILTCYAGINMLYMIITMGMLGGWLIVVGAVYALIITFMYQNSWKRFQQTGIIG